MDNADNLGDRVERFFVAPNRLMLNHGEDVLDFMAKAKEYESEIQVLQKELKEYTQVESKINTHLSKVSEWSSLEQSKRSSLRKRVEQTIANLEQQKVICRKKAKIKNEEHGFIACLFTVPLFNCLQTPAKSAL